MLSRLFAGIAITLFSAPVWAAAPHIAAGWTNSCAIDTTGQLSCWGDDRNGQLGQGRALMASTQQFVQLGFKPPVSPGQLPGRPSRIAIGIGHVAAIDADGKLWTWGKDSVGTAGSGSASSTPALIGSGFTAVAVGWASTYAIKADGSLWAWGANGNGLLGTGFVSVAAAGNHAAAIKADGSLWTWGANTFGSVGDGTTLVTKLPKQIGTGYSSVAVGWAHMAAIKSDGSLWAWGSGTYGQLGNGTGAVYAQGRTLPAQVGTGYASVAAGDYHTLAIKTDGSLWAWGLNRFGQLGDGTSRKPYSTDTPLLVGAGYVAIAAGTNRSAALKVDGGLWVWGDESAGYYGSTTYTNVPYLAGTDFSSLAAADFGGIGVKANGSLWVWGDNSAGQFGQGDVTYSTVPKLVDTGYAWVAMGAGHVAAVKADGSLWTWGANAYGELGDGKLVSRSTPAQVGTGFSAAAAGAHHTVALKTDGSVWEWGQLRNSTPTQVGSGYTAVAAAGCYSLGLKANATLWAWGRCTVNENTNGFTNPTPQQIGSGYAAIGAGQDHVVAIKTDGALWSWGGNAYGQLGDGSAKTSLVPRLIGTGFVAAAAGQFHTLGLKTDGSLWAWGYNGSRQLGDGSTLDSAAPKMIGTGYASIAAGMNHSLAVTTDGLVWSWGARDDGRLGDGTMATRLLPALVVNAGATGPLDLKPGVAKTLVPGTMPLFWAQVLAAAGRVTTNLHFDDASAGQFGNVYITAFLDPASPLLSATGASAESPQGEQPADERAAMGHGEPDAPATPVPLVEAVLTSKGWTLASSSATTTPVFAGALTSSHNAYSLYAAGQFDAAKHYGLICAGYASASGTGSAGLMRPLVSGASGSPTTCPRLMIGDTPGQMTVQLTAGWNMLGNGGAEAVPVATLFGDADRINAVWKWVAASSRWAIYLPGLADGGASYASANNLLPLTSVGAGEGFWVNAKSDMSVSMAFSSPVEAASFRSGQAHALRSGWQLVASGDGSSPAAFVQAAGVTAAVKAVWAWNRASARWYFYSPAMAAAGTLPAYLAAHGLADFGSTALSATTGFWVEK